MEAWLSTEENLRGVSEMMESASIKAIVTSVVGAIRLLGIWSSDRSLEA
jgi:hypothetical protein